MREVFGDHGGVALRAFTAAGKRYAIGDTIPAALAMQWPVNNRIALANQQLVRWIQAVLPVPAAVPAAAPTPAPAGAGGVEVGGLRLAFDPATASKELLRAFLTLHDGKAPQTGTPEDKLRARARAAFGRPPAPAAA